MNTKKTSLIIVLVFVNVGIYVAITYSHMQGSSDAARQIKAMVFAVSTITYLLLGIWMLKNKLYSRAPHTIVILISVALIGLFIASKTISLPVVGMDTDVDWIDIMSKATQSTIVVISLLVLRNWNKEKIKM
ncbi:MAG: hypothetical protein ACREBJ_07685 [Nitrosotalea sp.]